ncbi:MAG TPA: GtrA family protein [Chloroflexota bacterium]|nr:GtrA family protein [Chloroflexota bacterium]
MSRLRHVLPRPLRFVCAGGASAVVQLALLGFFTTHGLHWLVAELLALFVSAQASFGLNSTLTWHDRWEGASWPRRWVLFHMAIAGTTGLNLTIFLLAHQVLPPLPSSALGIGVAAVANFLIGDHLVFRLAAPAVAAPLPELDAS